MDGDWQDRTNLREGNLDVGCVGATGVDHDVASEYADYQASDEDGPDIHLISTSPARDGKM